MKKEIILYDESGKETTCEIEYLFSIDNIDYVAYVEDSNFNNLLVSKYQKDDDNINLIEITNEDEWKKVRKYIEENYFRG